MTVYGRSESGERVVLSPEDLEKIRREAFAHAGTEARRVVSRRHANDEIVRQHFGIAVLAWQERLELLAKKRELRQEGKTEVDPEIQDIAIEIEVQQQIIFNAFYQDPDALGFWLQHYLDNDDAEIPRVFRYSVQLCRKVGILRKATRAENDETFKWINERGVARPYFIRYKRLTWVLTDPDNQQYQVVHYKLEALRRRTNERNVNKQSEPETKTEDSE